jgi:hypothetical protein
MSSKTRTGGAVEKHLYGRWRVETGEIGEWNNELGQVNKKEDTMSIAHREVELTVRIGYEPTEMSAVGIIAWQPDVEVLAMRSYCSQDGVVLLLVTTNPRKASRVLEAAGFECKSNPIVMVGPLYRSGLASLIWTELAVLGIDVLYSYASRIEPGSQYLVFKTTDDARAMEALEVSASVRSVAQPKTRQDRSLAPVRLAHWQEAAA